MRNDRLNPLLQKGYVSCAQPQTTGASNIVPAFLSRKVVQADETDAIQVMVCVAQHFHSIFGHELCPVVRIAVVVFVVS